MKINVTDKILIDIYNIRNLESVKVYDASVSEDNVQLLVPAILITYDNGKSLNLCAQDKYFDVYTKKVKQVYNDEKNNIYESSLTDPFKIYSDILIDERTKNILLNGQLENIKDMYKFYDNKDSFEQSLLFQNDEVKPLFLILKYHLKQLFSLIDTNLNINKLMNGYRTNYIIEGNLDGVEKNFPIRYIKLDDDKYQIIFGGIFTKNEPIIIDIEFNQELIEVNMQVVNERLNANYQYFITDGMIKKQEKISKNNEIIYYKNEDLEQADILYKNLANFDYSRDFKWFILPWNAYYGLNTLVTSLSPIEKNIETHSMYIETFDDSYIRRDFYRLKYVYKDVPSLKSKNMILEEHTTKMIGICIDEENMNYLIETHFYNSLKPKGYYLTNLDGKYYYHLVNSKEGISKINSDMLIPLKKDSIFSKTNIINKAYVKKLMED